MPPWRSAPASGRPGLKLIGAGGRVGRERRRRRLLNQAGTSAYSRRLGPAQGLERGPGDLLPAQCLLHGQQAETKASESYQASAPDTGAVICTVPFSDGLREQGSQNRARAFKRKFSSESMTSSSVALTRTRRAVLTTATDGWRRPAGRTGSAPVSLCSGARTGCPLPSCARRGGP